MKTTKNDPFWDDLVSQIDEKEYNRIDGRMKMAARISNVLKQKGLTQKMLAEKLGKRPSEISKWLSGTHNFTLDTLSDIEYALGIKLLRYEAAPAMNKLENKKQILAEQQDMLFAKSN
jgi:transcriptional regulator with XRE-family HTH domain